MTKLSILIPTMPSRKEMFGNLWDNLMEQREKYGNEIEMISWSIESMTIGEKRNKLLDLSEGEYVCFIDDDDRISPNYIDLLMAGINKGVDCCSLKGSYSVDGVFDGLFEHSLAYKEWKTNNPYDSSTNIKYERYPNHLNCIKASIAKQFKFPETNFGEDHDWSKQIHESGLINTEYYIKDILYYYDKRTK